VFPINNLGILNRTNHRQRATEAAPERRSNERAR